MWSIEARPQVVERLLAAGAEPDDRRALARPPRPRARRRRSARTTRRTPMSTPSSPSMPWSIACWITIGTTTRPPAPTAASNHVSPRPWRSTGASSRPRPIAWWPRSDPSAQSSRPSPAPDVARAAVVSRAQRHATLRSVSNASTSSRYVAHRRASARSCGPCASMRPPARNTTSSASAIVDGRDATITTVVPASAVRRLSSTASSVAGSSADVVSSSSSRLGFRTSARARRDPLALPAAQPDAALADHGVEAVGQLTDELVRPGAGATLPTPPRRRWCHRGRARRCRGPCR